MFRRNRTTTAAATALFTLNSIANFPKASFSYTLNSFYLQNVIYSNKPISLLNKFSSFAERIDFYEEPHVNSKHSQVQQHPFNPIHQQTSFHHNSNNGFYRETPKPSVYTQNSDVGNNLVGKDRNFWSESEYSKIPNSIHSQSQTLSHQTPGNGVYREPQAPIAGSNLIAQERSFYNGHAQKPNSEVHGSGGVFLDLQQSRVNGYSNNQQMQSVWTQGKSFGVQGNPNGAYGGNVVGEFVQNRNECQSQANANLYCRAESGRSQQNLNGTYTDFVEESNKNKRGYQGQTNGDMCHRESSVGLQQNPIDLQIGVGGLSTSNNAKPDNKLPATCRYAGTVEELDTFCKEKKVKEALELLEILEKKGVTVDLPRYVLLIQACGNIGVLQFAKSVHAHLIRSEGHIQEVYVHNKILEMFSNCGSMCDAHEIFENMPERNLTSWDTMITGLAKNGHGRDAIDLFTRFKQSGLRPDGQMFMGVFLACSVLCDIDEGMLHFESMSNLYGIVPSMEHYTSVVKMLGSIGYLDEAMEFIEKMPVEPNLDIWETLMNLCGIHGNIELEDHCTKIVRYLDPSRLAEKSKEETSYHDNEIQKKSVLGKVPPRIFCEFKAGDKSEKIYALLKGVSAHMKEAGHLPSTRAVLHDVDEETKEEALLSHSERLAVAHGLIGTAPRQAIRIIKNLRVCVDCHNFLKVISKVVGRTLIIRDAKRFHTFENGSCNCNDFW